jgi:glutaminyl-peptide cyclotransferase
VQLTWRSGLGFVYDMQSMRVERTFAYLGEGWGLTQDGNRLIMSDGTAYLRFLDPTTCQEVGRLAVTDAGQPVSHLNELEMVNGRLFANVWPRHYIVMIDLSSGNVVGKVDLSGILKEYAGSRPVDVLNGIAYDPGEDRLFVTGKWWPVLFEIRLSRRT